LGYNLYLTYVSLGLRWVFEALVGGDLSEIEPEWLCSKDSNKSEDQIGVAKLQLEKTLTKLRRKNHVIVGHNLFMDLGFLYKTFKGPLPSKVEDFQEDIHELFPIVIDTKYLATRDADVMNPRSNLKELLEPFKKHSFPLIVLHEKHTAYGSSFGKEHEAGYDSWMTAELFVKLTAQLYAERNKIPGEVDDDFVSEGIEHLNFSDSNDSEGDTSSQGNGGVPLFSPNPFAVNKASEEPVKIEQFIPPMKNSFWDLYVNKLRVNGTDSGVCDLATVVDED
jgi:poly(A)-specific ribonuclease